MKPNYRSPYFLLFLVCVAAFIGLLFVSRNLAHQIVVDDSNSSNTTFMITTWLGFALIAPMSLAYYKTTKYSQTLKRQILVFLITPFALSPAVGIIYAIVVLTPLYNLANNL